MYGGDPEQPHKLHIVTRVKSTKGRPYWEKKVVKSLGLLKVSCISPEMQNISIYIYNSYIELLIHAVYTEFFIILYSA